jgi:hypothetical protein
VLPQWLQRTVFLAQIPHQLPFCVLDSTVLPLSVIAMHLPSFQNKEISIIAGSRPSSPTPYSQHNHESEITPLTFAKDRNGSLGRLNMSELSHIFALSRTLSKLELEPFITRVMQNIQVNPGNPTEAIITSVCACEPLADRHEEISRIILKANSLFAECQDPPQTKHLLGIISLLCKAPQDERLFVAFTPYDANQGYFERVSFAGFSSK